MNNTTARKTMSVFLFIFVIIFTATIKSVFADTRYVSDELIISVRDGQNQDDNVLGHIRTGTAVDVLEEKGRYLRIKTENGLEGWVQAQYIIPEKPNARIIEDLRNELNEQDALSDKFLAKKIIYEIRIRELEQELNINQKNTAKEKSEQKELNKKYKKLLSYSENTDELIKKLEKSKQLDSKLKTEISNLKKSSKNPLKSSMIQPFLAGAGILIVGFILGGLTRRRKKSKFY
jgi:SH3 domain protein